MHTDTQWIELNRKMILSQSEEVFCLAFSDTVGPGPSQTKSMAVYFQEK